MTKGAPTGLGVVATARLTVGRMKILLRGTILLLAWAVAAPLPGQIEFHGQVNPLVRLTVKQRYLSLPHRFVTLEGQRWGEAVSLYFSTALEYRLGSNDVMLDLREVYAEVATGLGDFRFGKQIFAWGAADGNNPTDNVSPYDFYYLFLPGTDRKLGNVAASANLYLGSVNLELVVTPVFQPNRLPLNEPDFPILDDAPFDIDLNKENRPTRELKNTELGIRVRLPLNLMDLSLSYFRGFDRMFTPYTTLLFGAGGPIIELDSLLYHPTQVFGGDVVTFLGDWALRAEGAYFLTKDRDGNDPLIRNPYLQYVLQLDRTGDQGTYLVQYLGTYISKIDDEQVFNPAAGGFVSEEENEQDHIPPKMGMPFAAIAQNAVLASASYQFLDGRYEVRGNALYDLDHGGFMVGGGLTIALEEAFDLELGLTLLGGGKESRLYGIRDFSHLYAAMTYHF